MGSREGCEASEVIVPFMGVADWSQVAAEILDANSEALSFFSEGGFRFFLPAYLIADLKGQLQTADPLFHLTGGFSDAVVQVPTKVRVYEKTIGKSALLNPRRYGAMTFYDYARYRLSIFAREEAEAIVVYLEYRQDLDSDGIETSSITAALDGFWRERTATAPHASALRKHVDDEAAYIRDLQER
ncbi:MAG: hypothetical protein OEZ41_06790 [Nitrospirota bacterium]|nr:hypothetical protein [Nitrospirota bacterium]MDH5699651.1 hypothetical protein [Nitrospirota bacterium]